MSPVMLSPVMLSPVMLSPVMLSPALLVQYVLQPHGSPLCPAARPAPAEQRSLACSQPGPRITRSLCVTVSGNREPKVVLAGAGTLKHSAAHFRAPVLSFVDES
jgi:hypothetical protein